MDRCERPPGSPACVYGTEQGFLALFTVVAEPTPAWMAVAGLVAFTALVLVFACWRIRRLEVSYTTE